MIQTAAELTLGFVLAAGAAISIRRTERTPVRLFNLIGSERGVGLRQGIAYGPLARQMLDVYVPPAGREKPAVALYFYGGGWRTGERGIYRFLGTALAARGVTTVVADYRLYPQARFPDFMVDAARAYRWVADHIADGPDGPRPIVLIGHSAGAHIGALLALDPSYRRRYARSAAAPAGYIGLAGPYAFDPTTWHSTREIFASAAAHPDWARPVALVDESAPPSLLLYGLTDDTIRPFNQVELAEALTRHGVPVKTVDYPRLGHIGIVTAIGRPLRWRAPVLRDMLDFIDGLPAPAALEPRS
jgi:acetyl esterase/lipase